FQSDYRRELVRSHSAKCIAGTVYVAAGPGESTTDLAWDGHGLVCEVSRLVFMKFCTEFMLMVLAWVCVMKDLDIDSISCFVVTGWTNSSRIQQASVAVCLKNDLKTSCFVSRFVLDGSQLVYGDIDIGKLVQVNDCACAMIHLMRTQLD
ncbi:MAG TPA: hypothetical protein V6C97_00735, partial [Oculatellaceae cyanobacterium]